MKDLKNMPYSWDTTGVVSQVQHWTHNIYKVGIIKSDTCRVNIYIDKETRESKIVVYDESNRDSIIQSKYFDEDTKRWIDEVIYPLLDGIEDTSIIPNFGSDATKYGVRCAICGRNDYVKTVNLINLDLEQRFDAISNGCWAADWTPWVHLNGNFDIGSACPACSQYTEENVDGLYEVILSRVPNSEVIGSLSHFLKSSPSMIEKIKS